MLREIILLTLKGLRSRPLRSWLTILWIVLWIMLIVTITSLWSGIKNAISKQLQMFWSNLIIVFPWDETNPFVWMIWWQKFRDKDLMDLENIEWVKYVVPLDVAAINTEFKWEKKTVLIHAAPWKNFIETFENGQWLKLEKWKWPKNDYTNEVVLWYLAYHKLFKNKINIWDEITLKSKKMKISWYISEIWNQTDDNVIYISMTMLRQLTWAPEKSQSALVKTLPNVNEDLLAKQIKHQLSKQELVQDFSVITPQKANEIIWKVLQTVELFLVFISLISLLVWWVGITNTMYMSVFERTRQIWIMKAIWANNDTILSLFLIESWIIGLVWWLIGIFFGIFIAFLVWVAGNSSWIQWLFSFASLDYFTLLVILIITFITWILSWILPAKKAFKMEPAEALRYE